MSLSQGGFLFLLLDVTMPSSKLQFQSGRRAQDLIYFFKTQINLKNRHKSFQIILFNLIIIIAVVLWITLLGACWENKL